MKLLFIVLSCVLFQASALAGPKGPSPDAELGVLANRELNVVQKPLFATTGRIELAARGVFFPYDPYVVTFHGAVGATTFVSETLAFELLFSYGNGFATYEAERLQTLDVQVDSYVPRTVGTFNVQWTPIYAKLNFLGRRVVHFDATLTAGGGAFFARRTVYGEVVPSSTAQRYNFPLGLDYGLLTRFFVRRGPQMGCVQLEVRDYMYLLTTTEVGTVLKHNVALGAGVGFFLPWEIKRGAS